MKKIFSISVVVLLILVFINSCKDDNTEIQVPCSAGKGGNVTFVVYATHSGVSIINSESNPDTVYIKFSASTSPGLSPANYDTFYVSETGEDHIHCDGLKCGDYFIYRTAFDTTTIPGTRYSGTAVLSVLQTNGEKEITIPVN